ncbi:MAG: hypothetical protein GQ523_12545 [Methanophagales archaeon]|jgi:hypothetical protein|nr:hypothetical protein [Methanophagales archaeon]
MKEEENKPRREELKRLAKESTGALSWIKLSEPLEKRLERIERRSKCMDEPSTGD